MCPISGHSTKSHMDEAPVSAVAQASKFNRGYKVKRDKRIGNAIAAENPACTF